jgi:hypothetical protein
LPGEVVGFALFDRSGLVAGVAGLMPALPSSVAPSGIPTRPIDEGEGRGDEIGRLSAQESEVLPASPPPSNKAAEGPAPSEPAQVVIPAFRKGSTGLMPGVAISSNRAECLPALPILLGVEMWRPCRPRAAYSGLWIARLPGRATET